MPIFMKLGDIKGEVDASPSMEIFAYDGAFSGGVRVPSGDDVVVDGRIITAENRDAAAVGDDVVVDGRIITAENWDAAATVPAAVVVAAGLDPF